jgi:hypothetical protein
MVTLLQNYLFLIDHLFSAEPTIPDPVFGGQASPAALVETPDEVEQRAEEIIASPETISPEPEPKPLLKAEKLPQTAPDTPSVKPRFYFKTVYKICQMAVARQQQINRGHVVQGIEVVKLACKGPSKNTLLKVTDLVLNWDDKDFQWDVVTWLHQSTQHTPDEITDLLNKLRLKFKPHELALITSSLANH